MLGAAHTLRASPEAPKRRNRMASAASLREQSVRAAVAERKDGLAAVLGLRGRHPLDDQVEGVVPGDPLERGVALRAGAPRRVQQAILAVEMARDAADLGADEAARQRMRDFRRRRAHLVYAAVADLDFERAGVGAVECAGGVVDRRLVGRGGRRICDRHASKRTPRSSPSAEEGRRFAARFFSEADRKVRAPRARLCPEGSLCCKPIGRSDAVTVAERRCAFAGVTLWVRGPSGPLPPKAARSPRRRPVP